MTATSVRPHSWESNLLVRALLQQELAIAWPEQENRERSVKQTLVDVAHKMAWLVGNALTSAQTESIIPSPACSQVFLLSSP